MKKNLPVTQKNIQIPENKILVSHTDLKGTITYANRPLSEVSGYSNSELLGRNQNIVRHPDVPPAFFEDLWNTIQQGKPWSGPVKNRAKNGDHYWVIANVAPIYQDGEVSGYISVRQSATAEQIALGEQLYQQVESGETTLEAGNGYTGLSGKFGRLNPLPRLGVRNKLMLLFALLSLLPLLLFGGVVNDKARDALESQVLAKLESVAANKRAAVERYFTEIHDQAHTFAEDRMVVEAMLQFRELFATYRDEADLDDAAIETMRGSVAEYYQQQFKPQYQQQNGGKDADITALLANLDEESIALQYNYISANAHSLGEKHKLDVADDDTIYSQVHEIYHPVIRDYLETFGYYDIFLVEPESGDIIYSVFKELDFSTSLIDGPYAKSGLGEVFQKANGLKRGEIAFVDFKQYLPSYDAPASFIGTPIFDGEEKVGVLIFQMPLDRISEVMSERSGLGESGESYLVGKDHLMRSDAYLDPNHSVVNSFRNPEQGGLMNPAIHEALMGNSGVMTVTDYRDQPVLSAYAPVKIAEGVVWGMEAKIDVEEAFIEVDELVTLLLWLGGLIVLVVVVASGVASHRIACSMRDVVALLSKMREGKLDNSIAIKGDDEVQQMRAALQITQVKLGADMDHIKTQAGDAMRVQVALDNVSTNVMVADVERNIIYLNRSVDQMLRRNEAELQKVLPHFKAEGLLGTNMDIFHANPEHQAKLLASLTELHVANIKVGPLSFTLKASPVIDESGMRLGTAVEWNDITEEVNAQQQLEALVSRAAEGELDQRLDTAHFEGFIKTLGDRINQMMEAVDAPVREVVSVVSQQAQGDLTQLMKGSYQGQFKVLQDNINEMSSSLKSVIGEVMQGSDNISLGASQISQGSADLSQRTQQQAASVEETAASMEEMTATVEQNSTNSEKANTLSMQARDVAERGSDVMQGAVASMQEMHEASAKIADIISTIDGIAFQTNLLALNAAVEAARAGDHGRGFAVVAGEVRSLAQRSAEAAKEIKGLIEDSIGKIEQGTTQVNHAGENLDEIVKSVQQVSGIVGEITAASMEQSEGIGQVNRAVSELDNATQQNAALVEETAAASENMNDQAVALRDRVKYFKVS